jgi:hypothetical protein
LRLIGLCQGAARRREICRIGLFAGLFFSRFSKPNTGATAVLVDEYDTLTDQDFLDQIESSGIPRVSPNLNVRNRIPMQTSRSGQVSDGPI